MSMSEKNETVNMNVMIAERSYPLKVLKADEERMHGAVKLVNDRIKEYQQQYEGKDKQDYMAMCLLNFAVEQMSAQTANNENDRLLEEKIQQLEELLSGSSE